MGMLDTPGGRIRLARMQQGLSSGDVVNSINEKLALQGDSISAGHYSNIENDKRLPSIPLVVAIADILQISIDEIFGRSIAVQNGGQLSATIAEAVVLLEEMDDDTQRFAIATLRGIHALDRDRHSLQLNIASLPDHSLDDNITPPVPQP